MLPSACLIHMEPFWDRGVDGLEWYVFALFHNVVCLRVTVREAPAIAPSLAVLSQKLGSQDEPGWPRHWLSAQAAFLPS